MTLHRHDVYTIIFIVLFSLVIWWPSRYLPYFWDSAGFVIPTTTDFLNNRPPLLITQHSDFAHPPLFPLFLSFIWRIFGSSRFVSHLTMFPFLPLILISTYFFIKKYLPRPYALLGVALVGFSPVVLAEYANIYIDLPSSAILALSLWLLSASKWLGSVICLSLSLLIKFPLFTVLPLFWQELPKTKRKLLLIPIITLFSWFLYHQLATGWMFFAPTRSISSPTTLIHFFEVSITFITSFFFSDGKVVLSGLFIAALILFFSKKLQLESNQKSIVSSTVISIATSAIFFILTTEIAPRYLIYLLPLYSLLICFSCYYLFSNWIKSSSSQFGIIVLIVASLIYSWRPSTKPTTAYEFLAPANLHIYDYIQSFREMAATIESTTKEAEVYGGFPENQMLTDPTIGYVSEPLNFHYCTDFKLNPEVLQLIVAHPYAPSQLACAKLLDIFPTQPQNRFETNGIWVEVYQVTASASATGK